MNIEQLNTDFGIADQLQIVEGKGGLPFIKVDNGKASALISLYGGQVLGYQPATANADLMFCSEHAYYQSGKAIKGGVPICWPWFGADPEEKGRPAHGFARNSMWTLASTAATENGDSKIILSLRDSDATRSLWPHAFELVLEVSIGDTLNLALTSRNNGDKPFTITQALHTYFKVGDIHQVAVQGLDGISYLDKPDNFAEKLQAGDIQFSGEVDRVYTNTSADLVINDPKLQRQIHINSEGSNTSVVWNPWADICAASGDLADNAYTGFVCVETANAASDIIIVPAGEERSIAATYQIRQR
jgi:glucose-6-phosphate 1-epimerase